MDESEEYLSPPSPFATQYDSQSESSESIDLAIADVDREERQALVRKYAQRFREDEQGHEDDDEVYIINPPAPNAPKGSSVRIRNASQKRKKDKSIRQGLYLARLVLANKDSSDMMLMAAADTVKTLIRMKQ
jgi:hypothetical protein